MKSEQAATAKRCSSSASRWMMSKQLATIATDVPLELESECAAAAPSRTWRH